MGHHHIHDIVELDDGFQSHVCFGIGKITRAAGVAILMHPRHKKWAKRKVVLSEKGTVRRCSHWQEKIESLQHMPHMQDIQSVSQSGLYASRRALSGRRR